MADHLEIDLKVYFSNVSENKKERHQELLALMNKTVYEVPDSKQNVQLSEYQGQLANALETYFQKYRKSFVKE